MQRPLKNAPSLPPRTPHSSFEIRVHSFLIQRPPLLFLAILDDERFRLANVCLLLRLKLWKLIHEHD